MITANAKHYESRLRIKGGDPGKEHSTQIRKRAGASNAEACGIATCNWSPAEPQARRR